jgi:hypothetical protein
MEDRHLVAYTLCAVLAVIVVAFTMRYLSNRRQFKIRQSGRGKTLDTNVAAE